MTRPGLIFDDHGNVWSTSTEDLKRYLASDLPLSGLLDEAVVDRGFVRVDRLDRGLRIQLRPDTLSQAAYAQLMHWLADEKENRIFLTTVADSIGERISTVSEIKQKIGVYVRNARMLSEKRLRRTPMPPSALGPNSPLRSFRQLWEHGIDPSDAEFVGACDRHFQGSYTLSEAVATGDLIIRMCGRGYIVYKQAYLSRCAGLRLEDDPDFEYGLWIKDAHRQALQSQQPLLEDVNVTFRGAGEAGRHVRYQRLIVPLSDGHGRKFLLSASVRTSPQVPPPEAAGAPPPSD